MPTVLRPSPNMYVIGLCSTLLASLHKQNTIKQGQVEECICDDLETRVFWVTATEVHKPTSLNSYIMTCTSAKQQLLTQVIISYTYRGLPARYCSCFWRLHPPTSSLLTSANTSLTPNGWVKYTCGLKPQEPCCSGDVRRRSLRWPLPGSWHMLYKGRGLPFSVLHF